MEPRRFVVNAPDRLRALLASLMALPVSVERPLEFIVREPRREKSHEQRKLWHAMLDDMGRSMGHTPGEMKQIVKAEYYGVERIKLPNGHVVEVIQSSEEEDRAGYSRLVDFTTRFAAENGITLQDQRAAIT